MNMKQNKIIPSVLMEMGYHAQLWKHLSQWDGVLACGAMEEREGEWIEKKRFSRHSHGKHNNRERRSVLRVTPNPLFIVFSRYFRVLSP